MIKLFPPLLRLIFVSFVPVLFSSLISRKKRFFVCLIVPVLCFGCAHEKPPLPSAPVSTKKQLDIIRRIVSHAPKISSISAFAKVYISMEGKTRRVKEVIIIDRSGHMRFESLNPFGQTSLLLIKRGGRVFFHNLMENKYMFMGQDKPVLDRILGVPVSLEDVRQIIFQDFSGALPGSGVADIVIEEDMFVVRYRGYIKKIRLKESGVIGSVQYCDTAGRVRFRVDYLKYADKKGILYPRKIRIDFPSRKIELGFDFKDMAINEIIDTDSFAVSIPAGAQRYR